LVNIKPILPGHVLVIPYRVVRRLTDLTTEEITDLFTTVQKVERMLARTYFGDPSSGSKGTGKIEDGSFNIAIQVLVYRGSSRNDAHSYLGWTGSRPNGWSCSLPHNSKRKKFNRRG